MHIALGSPYDCARGLMCRVERRTLNVRGNLPGVLHASLIANPNGGVLSLRRIYGQPTRSKAAIGWRTPGVSVRRGHLHLVTPGVSFGVLGGNWRWCPRTGGVVEGGGLTIGPRT